MGLTEEARAYIERVHAAGIRPAHVLPVHEARANLRRRRALSSVAPEPVAEVRQTLIPGSGGGLPTRLYRPAAERPLPVLVYFHGGGWVLGDLETSDPQCRAIANATPCAVVSVDYRSAPEHPYPAALDDAYAALEWASVNAGSFGGDPRRIAIGGDSAGGNLAAAAALVARDRKGPRIAFQLLTYPILDRSFDRPSYRENGRGYILTADDMRWFWGHYLDRPERGDEPYASPLRDPDLRGLPPALIMTAEFDVLRDEGKDYAERLRAAGVPVTYRCFEGAIHGFLGMCRTFATGAEAVLTAAAALRSAFDAVAVEAGAR